MEESYLRILMVCAMLPLLLSGVGWLLVWRRLSRRIDERIDECLGGLEGLLERHAAECPLRKENLLASCLPADPDRKKDGAFHRSFRTTYPGFLPRLRERVPGITPVEETLCMLIKMNLSNREIADKMSISVGSLHTTRYRLKQKMLPEDAKVLDDWVRAIE
ncbi:helix-turn-helix transcriptional regulator [Parabacteroides sp. ZJ-118]|uniref:helix-turn-helix transcriptional regulator n=1 Tax=Parabacteroides sp. ZJ-118 TaxID=2709398 RepID=UPI0013EBF191|nr:helix-turn-helix transcriptional regulator [Parabacteroides sp. ZJ-118]